MKLFIKISYLGTAYCGYQVQPNGVSIQQQLNHAAEVLFGFPCDIVGCSRTDSGVHANAFCATVAQKKTDHLQTAIPIERIPLAFSAHLPSDICVFDAAWVPSNFHPRYDVLQKEYLYRIYNRPVLSPMEFGRACHIPKPIGQDGIENMKQAASLFLGEHDFSAYMAQGSKITDAVRCITLSQIEQKGHLIVYRVRANGFLYNMVRILAGTLLAVGEGKLLPEQIPMITESRDRTMAGITMPAHGLYLNQVFYPSEKLPFFKDDPDGSVAEWEAKK